VENKGVLHTVMQERNILHNVKQRRAKCFGHISHRKRLLNHIIEGETEGKRRQGRRCKQILDDLADKIRY
jgi:hypothetical protein